jgi:DNA invertase Pin-like site-specific DNA recombinase
LALLQKIEVSQMGRLSALRQTIQKTSLAAVLKDEQIQCPSNARKSIRQTIEYGIIGRYDLLAYRRLMMPKRAAIYVRVSTDKQTIENQLRELRQIAKRRGWEVVHEYHDTGISGAKSRDARPALDQMLKDAQRRRFDVVMAWAIDRLGRSLIDLLGTIQTLETCGVDLYLDQQSIDTTTPAGRLTFQITGAFAEFERRMIRQRVLAGLKRAVEKGSILGRPKVPNWKGVSKLSCGPGKAF